MKFAIGHQGATESHPSNVGAQVGHSLQHSGGWVGVQVRKLDHELGHAGENGRQSHQAVEGCHQLGQVGDLDTLGNGETWSAASGRAREGGGERESAEE